MPRRALRRWLVAAAVALAATVVTGVVIWEHAGDGASKARYPVRRRGATYDHRHSDDGSAESLRLPRDIDSETRTTERTRRRPGDGAADDAFQAACKDHDRCAPGWWQPTLGTSDNPRHGGIRFGARLRPLARVRVAGRLHG